MQALLTMQTYPTVQTQYEKGRAEYTVNEQKTNKGQEVFASVYIRIYEVGLTSNRVSQVGLAGKATRVDSRQMNNNEYADSVEW